MSLHCIVWCCMVLYCWLRRAGCISQDTYLLYIILLARREGGQVQSNFLKSYISSLFVASLSYNRCYFCGKINVFTTLSVQNLMSSSTFVHFKTLLLSSCGSCPILNWFSTSTLQIAHKRHAAAKRNIHMVLPAIYEIWVIFQRKGGCMMWQGEKIFQQKNKNKDEFC